MVALDPTLDPGAPSPQPAPPLGGEPQLPPAPAAALEPAEDWKKRHAGMQTAYQALKAQYDQQTVDLQAARQSSTQTQAQNEALTSQLTDVRTALESANAAEVTRQKTAAEMQAKLNMHDMIFDEYHDLAPFAKLIPIVEGEEAQKAALKELQDSISGVIEQRVTQSVSAALSGVTPPTSPARVQNPSMGLTDEQLTARLDQVIGAPGKEDEARVLMAEFYRRQEAQ